MSVTRRTLSIAAATLALVAASSPAIAQTRAFGSSPTTFVTPDTALAGAAQLYLSGHWREARNAYQHAISEARTQGEYGREAFEGLANTQFALEDIKGAARTLDELGERASAYGDPETEVMAFFKSALLFQQAGDKVNAGVRVPRLKTLIQSALISEATRRMVEERIEK